LENTSPIAGDVMKEKLRNAIQDASDEENALSDTDRRDKLANLKAKKLVAERHVEHFLFELEKAGMQVVRVRGASSPEAILGLEVA